MYINVPYTVYNDHVHTMEQFNNNKLIEVKDGHKSCIKEYIIYDSRLYRIKATSIVWMRVGNNDCLGPGAEKWSVLGLCVCVCVREGRIILILL